MVTSTFITGTYLIQNMYVCDYVKNIRRHSVEKKRIEKCTSIACVLAKLEAAPGHITGYIHGHGHGQDRRSHS